MLVTTLPPEAGAGESDARLAAGRRNTAAFSSPEANADLRTLLEAFPLLCPADGDLPDVMDTLRLRRRLSPEADADLAPPLGLARSCFRVIAPTYTHTSLTLLTVLCLSLFGFVELLGFVYFGGVFSMWGFAYFSRSELNGLTWPALISQCPKTRLSERLTRPVGMRDRR